MRNTCLPVLDLHYYSSAVMPVLHTIVASFVVGEMCRTGAGAILGSTV